MTAALLTKSERGGFFALDPDVFEAVAAHGSLNLCAAYWIIAQGTGGDHRTSTWGAQAIQRRLGCRWPAAAQLLKDLIEMRTMRRIPRTGWPRYDVLPARERIEVTGAECRAVTKALAGDELSNGEKAHVRSAQRKGFIEDDGSGWQIPPRRLVWLPDDLWNFIRSDGRSPMRALLAARSIDAFRLLIRLYELQDLPGIGGVHWRALRREFERSGPVRAGALNIWSFCPGDLSVFWDQFPGHERAEFWEALESIEDAGLLEWVVTLVEADEDGAATMFPVGVLRNGRRVDSGPEFDIGSAAREAATRLAGEPTEDAFAIPVERLARKVQLVGLPRLIFRANVKPNADWLDELTEMRDHWVQIFAEM